MPFLDHITAYINQYLKGGSLNKRKLQPAAYYGATTFSGRKKPGGTLEQLPTIIGPKKMTYVTPESKYALQVFHRLLSKTYALVPESYGDEHFIKAVCDLNLVVMLNSKLTGKTKDVLEPAVLFGLPQKLSAGLITELQLKSCLIQPVSSNMDPIQVFRQEFPTSGNYFLNEANSIFSIRYKVTMEFSRDCVEQCLCDMPDSTAENVILTEDDVNLLAEQ